jgi:hypothetical protein
MGQMWTSQMWTPPSGDGTNRDMTHVSDGTYVAEAKPCDGTDVDDSTGGTILANRMVKNLMKNLKT